MKLLKRLQFAYKYDFDPDFVVVPHGTSELSIMQFVNYADALAFTEKEANEKPMYGKPGILIRIKGTRK